jgi:hypothetical protein
MDMAIDFASTNARIYLIPFASTILTIALLRLFLGAWRGAVLAAVGIGSGFLISYFLVRGYNLWPPFGALGILPFVAIAGILAGTFLDVHDAPPSVVNLFILALSFAIVGWVAFEWNSGVISGDGLVLYGALVFAGYWLMQRLYDNRDFGLASSIAAFSGAFGLILIADVYGTRTGLFASGLAAAIAGYMVWNWPKYRYPWGAVGTLVAGGIFLTLASELAIKNEGLAFPVGITMTCFIVYDITSRLFPVRQALQPFIQIAASAIPIAAAAYMAS